MHIRWWGGWKQHVEWGVLLLYLYGFSHKIQAIMDSFFDAVHAIVAKIPYGKVVSYGQIACMLGSPLRARTVGWAMHQCPDDLPWQRVVKSDGSLAGGDHAAIQKAILLSEGVQFIGEYRVSMQACQWDGC
ncbi:MGMT family protein [Sphaerochaeta sp.]|jgi:methylated-DNA-protein-cysteine methyltransferase-like protein|uniref:MGMT family protein n=1 Tax=Sphaerochaeta sp. TaxID=1972642 RepID=UPI002FCA1172